MIQRPKPVYLADALVEVELFDERERVRTGGRKATRYALTVAGEQRHHGRLLLFPSPALRYDDADRVVGIYLAIGPGPEHGGWLVNDGVVGTLPVFAFDQHAARALADAFVLAVRNDVLDQTPGQVTGWCEWWIANNTGCRPITGWPAADGVQPPRVEVQPARVERVPDHVEGTLDVQLDERGLFTPAVQPDPVVIPEQPGDQPGAVDQAPALTHTVTEAVNR